MSPVAVSGLPGPSSTTTIWPLLWRTIQEGSARALCSASLITSGGTVCHSVSSSILMRSIILPFALPHSNMGTNDRVPPHSGRRMCCSVVEIRVLEFVQHPALVRLAFPALRDRLRDQGTDRQENVVAPAVSSLGAPDKPDYYVPIPG